MTWFIISYETNAANSLLELRLDWLMHHKMIYHCIASYSTIDQKRVRTKLFWVEGECCQRHYWAWRYILKPRMISRWRQAILVLDGYVSSSWRFAYFFNKSYFTIVNNIKKIVKYFVISTLSLRILISDQNSNTAGQVPQAKSKST